MSLAEIIEGLKEIYYMLYAITDHRKTLEACLKLLESENALIDRVLEIIDLETSDPSSGEDGDEPMSYAAGWMACGFLIKDKVLALKEGEQE